MGGDGWLVPEGLLFLRYEVSALCQEYCDFGIRIGSSLLVCSDKSISEIKEWQLRRTITLSVRERVRSIGQECLVMIHKYLKLWNAIKCRFGLAPSHLYAD